MNIIDSRFLSGPNIHSHAPCYLAILELEKPEEMSPADVPGFTGRLLEMLPGLLAHRSSEGRRAGFVERLQRGTTPAHIVEHITLQLQALAGHDLGFDQERAAQLTPGLYRVVVAYRAERVVARALQLAIDVVRCLAAHAPFDLAAAMGELRALVERDALGPSTQAIVDAARRRDIPVIRIGDKDNLFQFGWGARQKRVQATTTSRTNTIAVEIASDKALTKALLEEAGLPVPKGQTARTLEEARLAACTIGGPVVVKPLDGNQGKGVSTSVVGREALQSAWDRATAYASEVIVETHVEGDDYRILVIGSHVVAAARRRPPEVTGDGHSTVRDLVERVNAEPDRGDGHENVLTKIRLDEAAAAELARQGLDFHYVLEAGRVARLRSNANLSTGGSAEDVTDRLHPDTGLACLHAAETIGLDVAGIDIVCEDIGRPLREQRGAIIEVNAAPGIRMHEHPSRGERHPVGEAICQSLFPADDGRIPVIAITGSAARWTTLAIARVLQQCGRTTGAASTAGVFIDGRRIADADCSGQRSARSVLTSPRVQVAVLETTPAGILGRGLPFDACDVGVVLDVPPDDPGQDGMQARERLSDATAVVAASARRTAVLNADDERCAGMATRLRPGCEALCFSMDGASAILRRHVEAGGRAVCLEDDAVMLRHGDHRVRILDIARLPFMPQVCPREQVQGALAAIATLVAMDLAHDDIARAIGGLTGGVEAGTGNVAERADAPRELVEEAS
jgi:cyanophycin synthetase